MMGAEELAGWISLVALFIVLAADLTFITLNHLWVPWRSNPWGRHVMLFSYALAGLLLFGLARRWLGDYPGRAWVLAAFYAVLAGALVQRVYLLVRSHLAQRQTRNLR